MCPSGASAIQSYVIKLSCSRKVLAASGDGSRHFWVTTARVSHYASNTHILNGSFTFVEESRQLSAAAKSRGPMGAPMDMPEWKRHITGGHKASYGKKESRSILEQRQGLPIFKLRNELIQVRHDLKIFCKNCGRLNQS